MSIATSQKNIGNHLITNLYYKDDYLDHLGRECLRTYKPTFILMRGVSGSGKSCAVQSIQDERMATVGREMLVASADNYFYRDGEYNFDHTLLADAHAECSRKVEDAVSHGRSIILDNTNVLNEHMKPYIDMATYYGHYVQVVELTPPLFVPEGFENRNLHKVPRWSIERQLHTFERISLNLLRYISRYHILPICH